ncbi:MAG TPA: hypothetical protein VLA88_00500 [Candidatus Saccharimonadales bacterium]|nr:hypothetical protein [Candidatus Saccharimonadales bacterium]
MTSLVVIGLLFGVLFLLSFLTRRRFGVLGLGLAAGSLLALHWTGTLTPFIEKQGFTLVVPPLSIVVQSALILAPPLVLLASGPTYSKMLWRLLGSLAFAALALAFLRSSIGSSLQLDGPGLTIYNHLKEYESLIIVAGLVAAIVDMFLTRKPKGKDGKKAH